MTYAIISLMCCFLFHCFKYVYNLSLLHVAIWNLKYSNSSARASAQVLIT